MAVYCGSSERQNRLVAPSTEPTSAGPMADCAECTHEQIEVNIYGGGGVQTGEIFTGVFQALPCPLGPVFDLFHGFAKGQTN